MASLARRRAQNVAGDFYVDQTCIDCDTCRWMAPETYHEADGKSAVHHQPETPEQRVRALQALVACPTASIGTTDKAADLGEAVASFPLPVADGVYHCGFHAESSFGAASYFVQRPEGNVLVDAPRYASALAQRLDELGGVDLMVLTHKDDVADHAKYADRFGCERVLHADDVTRGTRDVERKLEGEDAVDLGGDLTAIPVPGHTKGHTVFHYRTFLFTGDHLAWSERRGRLTAFRRACWYSWPKQTESMKRLREYDFEWVLPGHGRRANLPADEMRDSLERCIAWMQTT